MVFEKSVRSIVAYGWFLTCVTPVAFIIDARHANGMFAMKCITLCSDMTIYINFQTQILLHKQYIFDTNIIQSEYAFLFPFSIFHYIGTYLIQFHYPASFI